MEGTPGDPGGARAACSYHSVPCFWPTAAAAAAGGCCYCPELVGSRQSAGTNPPPDGSPTGTPAGGGTPGPGRRTPQSHWRGPLLSPAPGRRSSHRRAWKSCRNTRSSAFLRGEEVVVAFACAPVLAESHCRKTIWYRGSRDGASPTVPCNLT